MKSHAATKATVSADAIARTVIDWGAEALCLAGAFRAPLAEAFAPQLAETVAAPPLGEGWLHEVKWSGFRVSAIMLACKVRLWSENTEDWTNKYPQLVAAIERLGVKSIALDAVLIVGHGTQENSLPDKVLRQEERSDPSLVIFDVLHINGVDLSCVPLIYRKMLLQRLLVHSARELEYSKHIWGSGVEALTVAAEKGYEGTISKRVDGIYRPGRGDGWRKNSVRK